MLPSKIPQFQGNLFAGLRQSSSMLSATSTQTAFTRLLSINERDAGYESLSRPINKGIVFVPTEQAYVVERFGEFTRVLKPGLNFLIPIVDRIAYRHSTKEEALIIPGQSAITKDNVSIHIVGILYFKIFNPILASYGVGSPVFALEQLAQTTMRSTVGQMTLQDTFYNRDSLNMKIIHVCNEAAEKWGIKCIRHEVREIAPPADVQKAMEMQIEADRKRRVDIITSEGSRQAQINIAEGIKQATILKSEAFYLEQLNEAKGKAEAAILQAEADAKVITVKAAATAAAIKKVADAGDKAITLHVAELYIKEFGNLAKKTNTIIMPSTPNDVSSFVTQAMTIFGALSGSQKAIAEPKAKDLQEDGRAEQAVSNCRAKLWT